MAATISKDGLVAGTASRLRAMVLAQPADTPIGSLPDIAGALGVGVVTVRQAARLLEHEGFLTVRRGNGGGFYGTRPDAAALGRAVAGFLQIDQSHEREAIEIMTLLDCDLIAAAALCDDETLRSRLRDHARRIDACDTAGQRAAFVTQMHDILFRMVDRPLTEMLARLTMQHFSARSGLPIYSGAEETERWKAERHGIISAILRGDAALARFEAQRRRDYVLQRMAATPRA